jgi:hypothetical protein
MGRAVPALLVLAFWPAALMGQVKDRGSQVVPIPLSVVAQRDLEFGDVFRGRPSAVAPRDRRAAVFRVEFAVGCDLLLTFLLPNALRSPGGQALPLQFGPGDGLLVRQGAHHGAPIGHPFDPTRPLSAIIGHDEQLFLHLGGTAAPTVTQGLASYTGTITLVVAALGT